MFTQWLPDPSTTPIHDGYGIEAYDLTTIRDRQDVIHENAYERLRAAMTRQIPGKRFLDVESVETAFSVGFDANVALGSFDTERFTEQLTSRDPKPTEANTPTRTPWADPEAYRGFDLYGTDYVYAVSEDAILSVSTMRDSDPRDLAKSIIDTQADDSTTYVDGNAYVDAMLGLVDEPHALECYPEAMDGSTTRGFRTDSMTGVLKSWRFGAETTQFTFANTYPDEERAADADLAGYIDDNEDRFGSYDGLAVETEGLLCWTRGTTPTGEFDHLSPGDPEDGVHTANSVERTRSE